jgi:hypothetical protein
MKYVESLETLKKVLFFLSAMKKLSFDFSEE